MKRKRPHPYNEDFNDCYLEDNIEPYLEAFEALSNGMGVETINRSLLSKINMLPSSNKEEIIEVLFNEITNKSKNFILSHSSENEIIYSDPTDPKNPEKQIKYLYNEQTQSWDIILGKEANGIISYEEDRSIIQIKNGTCKTYGKSLSFHKTSSDTIENKNNYIIQYNQEKQKEALGEGNHLFLFNVPKDKEEVTKALLNDLKAASCSKARSGLIGQIINYLGDDNLVPIDQGTAYYEENGIWYLSHNSGECILSGKNRSLNLNITQPQNNCYLALSPHKDDQEGFAGASFIYSDSNGNSISGNNTSKNNPTILNNNITYISVNDSKAITNKSRAEYQKVITKQNPALYKSSNTLENNNQNQPANNISAPIAPQKSPIDLENIKVTGPNGEEFKLRCQFAEKNCLDKSISKGGRPYGAYVLVFERVGTELSFNDDKSNSLILEIVDEKNIYVRSGFSGETGNAVQAKISINLNGKEHSALLAGNKDNIEQKLSSPILKTNDYNSFMCTDGCCGHYSLENKFAMKGTKLQSPSNNLTNTSVQNHISPQMALS